MTIDADAQDASPVTLATARAEFDADVTYLDTAAFLGASILRCTVFFAAVSASPGTGCRDFCHGSTRRRAGKQRAGGCQRCPLGFGQRGHGRDV